MQYITKAFVLQVGHSRVLNLLPHSIPSYSNKTVISSTRYFLYLFTERKVDLRALRDSFRVTHLGVTNQGAIQVSSVSDKSDPEW